VDWPWWHLHRGTCIVANFIIQRAHRARCTNHSTVSISASRLMSRDSLTIRASNRQHGWNNEMRGVVWFVCEPKRNCCSLCVRTWSNYGDGRGKNSRETDSWCETRTETIARRYRNAHRCLIAVLLIAVTVYATYRNGLVGRRLYGRGSAANKRCSTHSHQNQASHQ
jgi:hypothetical protein